MKKPNIKKHGIWILILFMIAACNDEETTQSCTENNPEFLPAIYTAKDSLQTAFYYGSKLDYGFWPELNMTFTMEIKPGANTVFYFRSYKDPSATIEEDQFEEFIVFEIAPNQENFHFSGYEELNSAKVKYAKRGFDGKDFSGYLSIKSGCITGEKLSDTEWQIDINVGLDVENVWTKKMISERFSSR